LPQLNLALSNRSSHLGRLQLLRAGPGNRLARPNLKKLFASRTVAQS
jgi:hypothetical protein